MKTKFEFDSGINRRGAHANFRSNSCDRDDPRTVLQRLAAWWRFPGKLYFMMYLCAVGAILSWSHLLGVEK